MKDKRDEELFLRMAKAKSKKEYVEARNEIVLKYERLVKSLAGKWARKVPMEKTSFEDLAQAGRMGLITAAEKFELPKGVKFISFAPDWINAYIIDLWQRENFSDVDIPKNVVWQQVRYLRAKRELTQRLARMPSLEEVSQELGISPKELAQLIKEHPSISFLDQPIFGEDDDSGSLESSLPSEKYNCPVEKTDQDQLAGQIEKILKEQLTEQEMEIVFLRFGMKTGVPLNSKEIEKMLSLKRERVRQIFEKALRKIRPHLKKFARD